jgi:quercetin dioxygenase-like cupin family protein
MNFRPEGPSGHSSASMRGRFVVQKELQGGMWLVRGEATDGRYCCGRHTAPVGFRVEPHRHLREDEAYFVLAGEMSVEVEGVRQVASAGSWVHIPRGAAHSRSNDSEAPTEYLFFFTPAGIEGMFDEQARHSEDGDLTDELALEISRRYYVEQL